MGFLREVFKHLLLALLYGIIQSELIDPASNVLPITRERLTDVLGHADGGDTGTFILWLAHILILEHLESFLKLCPAWILVLLLMHALMLISLGGDRISLDSLRLPRCL